MTLAVAEYAASTWIEKIPAEVRERAKQVILDEMACACFGRRSTAGDLAAAMPPASAGPRSRGYSEPGSGRLRRMRHWPTARPAMAKRSTGRMSSAGTLARPSFTPRWRWPSGSARPAPNSSMRSCSDTTWARGWSRPAAGCSWPSSRYHLHSDFLYARRRGGRGVPAPGPRPGRHCHAMALVLFSPTGCALCFRSGGTSASRFRLANTLSPA